MQTKIKIILFSFSFILNLEVLGQDNFKRAMDDADKCFTEKKWDCAMENYSLAKKIAVDRRMSKDNFDKADDGRTKALGAKVSTLVKNSGISNDNKLSPVYNKIPPQNTTQLSPFKYAVQLDFPSNYYTNSTQNVNSLVENIKILTSKPTEKKPATWKDVSSDALFYTEEFRLQGVDKKNTAKFLYDSTLNVISNGGDLPEHLLALHLRTVLHHGWDLLDVTASNTKMLDSLKFVLQQSVNIVTAHSNSTSKVNFARAGFENLLRAFYIKINDGNNAFKHGLLAADYITKAVKEEPNNAYYWGSLYVYVRNLKSLPDTTISQSLKRDFTELSYNIAYYLENSPVSSVPEINSILLSVKLSCINDKHYEYVSAKKYLEDLDFLKRGIDNKENKFLRGNREYAPIYIATTYIKIANLYDQYIKDSSLNKYYTQKAADTIIYFLKNNSLSQYRWTGWFLGAIDDVIMKSEFVLNKVERKTLSESLVEAIQNGKNDYFENQEISYAYSNANSLLASMLLSNKLKSDSMQALTYLANSIELFEKNSFLDTYSTYSEDYAKFCSPFGKIIKIYSVQGNYIMAKKYYESMIIYFKPIIEKYKFDFYFMQHIIGASESYGEFLFKSKRFKEAITPLQFSSYEGIKQSTEYLIDIYSSSNLKNKALLDTFTARNNIQSKNMKRFTVPIECGGVKFPFDVYVFDRAKGHTYRGIEDQVQWLKEARGCNVQVDVVSSFNKLQEIAWKNNVSFQDLCVYALGEANKTHDLEKLRKDFEKGKNNVSLLLKGKNIEELKAILGFYLEDKGVEDAKKVTTKILFQKDDPTVRDAISYIYLVKTGDDNFSDLFLSNNEKITEYRV